MERRLIKPTTPQNPDIQGEGNYDAGRRYDKAARKFAKSGKVKGAAQAARPDSAEEAAELERAEQEGKSHSNGDETR